MMPPWHCLPHRRCLSALPPLSPSRKWARDGQQLCQGTIFRSAAMSSCAVIHAAAINAATGASKEQLSMPRHRCPCHHQRRCHAQLFALLPSLPLWEKARNGQQCRQGTLFCWGAIVVVHRHPRCCHQRLRTSKQGTGNDAKALLSVPPPPLLSRTIVHAAAVIAIVQEGKERPAIPRHHRPCHCHLLSLCTIVHTAAIVVVAREGKEKLTMPRYCHPHSRHCHC
jgi:hypothetical protein